MTNYPNEISTLNSCRASRKCRTPNSQPKFAIESEEDASGDLSRRRVGHQYFSCTHRGLEVREQVCPYHRPGALVVILLPSATTHPYGLLVRWRRRYGRGSSWRRQRLWGWRRREEGGGGRRRTWRAVEDGRRRLALAAPGRARRRLEHKRLGGWARWRLAAMDQRLRALD
jgi:hypothetical protein